MTKIKLLATGDFHSDVNLINAIDKYVNIDEIDFVLFTGDLSDKSDDFNKLLHIFKGKQIFMVPGNHETRLRPARAPWLSRSGAHAGGHQAEHRTVPAHICRQNDQERLQRHRTFHLRHILRGKNQRVHSVIYGSYRSELQLRAIAPGHLRVVQYLFEKWSHQLN